VRSRLRRSSAVRGGAAALPFLLVGSLALAQATDSPEPVAGQDAISTLACTSDLIMHMTGEVGPDVFGGPATPEEAIDLELAQDFPALIDDGVFSLEASITAGSTIGVAQYVLDGNEGRVASAYVEWIGDSYYVTDFVVCASLVPSSEPPEST
jgi:hypothetical protein